eukprot:scaffold447_cov307-Pinguiococcus_pyrenoidosus.AAC.39
MLRIERWPKADAARCVDDSPIRRPIERLLGALGGRLMRHQGEDLIKVQYDALVGHGLELVAWERPGARDASRRHSAAKRSVLHRLVQQDVIGDP